MNIVVDASVAIKWFVPEQYSDDLERLLDERFKLHAPELLIPEFANILWKKCRLGDLTKRQADKALSLLRRQQITYHPHAELIKAALQGAHETDQPVYDWTYLALAIALSGAFVTADRRFFIAMRKTRFKNALTWIENIPEPI